MEAANTNALSTILHLRGVYNSIHNTDGNHTTDFEAGLSAIYAIQNMYQWESLY